MDADPLTVAGYLLQQDQLAMLRMIEGQYSFRLPGGVKVTCQGPCVDYVDFTMAEWYGPLKVRAPHHGKGWRVDRPMHGGGCRVAPLSRESYRALKEEAFRVLSTPATWCGIEYVPREEFQRP